MVLYIPYSLNFFITHKQTNVTKLYNLTIYRGGNYITINILDIQFTKSINLLKINLNREYYLILSVNTLIQYIYSTFTFFLKKIIFKGKGYKIVKKKRALMLYFNNSHITWILFFKIFIIKNNKYKTLFLSKNPLELAYLLRYILSIRYINPYTKRGVREVRQKIFKKIGKRT